MEGRKGVPIFNNVIRLGLTKKVILGRLERGELSNIDVKRKNSQHSAGRANAKFLR